MRRSRKRDEQILSGLPEPDDQGLGSFVGAVRDAFGAGPDEAVARTHLAAMSAAARTARAESEEGVVIGRSLWSRGLRLAAVGAAIVVALMSVGTGLSFAGVVTLPEPVRAVLHGVGIDLPDGDDADDADEVSGDADEQGEDADEADDAGESGDDADEADDEADDVDDDADEVDEPGDDADESDQVDDADQVDEVDDGGDEPDGEPETDDSGTDGHDGESGDSQGDGGEEED